MKNYSEEWYPVGRFSEISSTSEEGREFLEAIIRFRAVEEKRDIGHKGFIMPDLVRPDLSIVHVGVVFGLELAPDDIKNPYSDGEVIVFKRRYHNN